MTKEEMIYRIDLVADTQRTKIVGDPARTFEYMEAETQAKAFAANNYEGPVPDSVDSWCIATGLSPIDSANSILEAAGLYRYALSQIRRIRLVGKQFILREEVTLEQAQSKFDETITMLKMIEL